jgi:hypothetical protein
MSPFKKNEQIEVGLLYVFKKTALLISGPFFSILMFQLHKKYPLYSGASVSFCQDNIRYMVGVTRSVDPLAPLKKNSAFTKPLHEILDDTSSITHV